MTTKYLTNGKPDPSKFPEHARWATYIQARNPEFKLHSTLALAKNAITYKMNAQRTQTVMTLAHGAYVYEWVDDPEMGGGSWVERFHVARGDVKETHPLWKYVDNKPKKVPEVPEATIAKTIESILSAGGHK